MFRALTRDREIPAGVYFAALPRLLMQGVTQMRWKNCDDRRGATNWARHLVLVSGYGTIFTLVVVFLPWFQVEDSSLHWTSLLGYYSTAVLLGSTAWMLAGPGRQADGDAPLQPSFRLAVPDPAFSDGGHRDPAAHLPDLRPAHGDLRDVHVHLAIAVPMLVVEVPFGKWAHLLYSPLAMYVAAAGANFPKGMAADERG